MINCVHRLLRSPYSEVLGQRWLTVSIVCWEVLLAMAGAAMINWASFVCLFVDGKAMEYCDGVPKRGLSAQMDARQWGDDEVRQYLWDDIDDKEWRFMSCRLNEIEWKGAMRRGWNVKLLRQDHNFLVASEIATYAMAFDNWQLGEAGATMPEFLCEKCIDWLKSSCVLHEEGRMKFCWKLYMHWLMQMSINLALFVALCGLVR